MRRLWLLAWLAGVAAGLAGEGLLYGFGDPGHWVPDLVTGWTLIGCGLVASRLVPGSRSGLLMTMAGFAWFAPNFASAGVGAVDWLAAHALYLHRGPLVALVLTYPRGRADGRIELATLATGYAVAVVTPVWRSDTATIILAGLLVAVAVHGQVVAVGRARRAHAWALSAAVLLGAVLAASAVARLAVPVGGANSATLLGYEIVLCLLAFGLLVGLMRSPWEHAAVTDLVVELGEARSGTLHDALARALGDPSLQIGYWLPDAGAYVDTAGRPVELPGDGSERAVTRIDRDGRPLAALVHDPVVLGEPSLVEAVAAAARLAASNARLQAEVRAQVDELRASRTRVLRAGDEERRRLEQRLREGTQRRLSDLATALAQAPAGSSPETLAKVERAQDQVARTRAELGELAAGLHPRALAHGGLSGALAALAQRSPVPIELAVAPQRLPADVEVAAYFVCSEALANAAKYAPGSRVVVSVMVEGDLVRVDVADDGGGGADPARGSGLRGLADRVEALGGSLGVDSPLGGGTRLVVELPLGPTGSA
jgi:signal transduction histidine kinase